MDRSARLANMEGRRNVVSVNYLVDYRKCGILGILVHFVFWSSFCLDYVEAGSPYACAQASATYLPPLPVASLCYETSATAYRVVLDGFLTYNSSTSNCGCALSTTQNTTVNFAYVQSSLQPGYQNCGSSLLIQAAATSFTINCYVAGTVEVSYLQPMTIYFVRPNYGYNSDYCILLTSVNENADLTLSCNGDFNLPTTTQKPPSSSTTTTTTTTTTPKPTTPELTTTTTTTTTTPLSTTTTPTTITNPTTTKLPTTTTTTKQPRTTPITTQPMTTTTTTTTTKQSSTTKTTSTMGPTTTLTTNSVSSTTMSSTDAPSTYNPTSRSSVTIPTTAKSQLSAESSSAWSYVIPAIGGGLILLFAIIMAACYSHRNKRNNLYHSTNELFAYDNKINSPYSSKNLYDDGPGMTSSLSATAEIKAIIVDDVRDDMSDSTNVSEGTFVRHSVRQPTSSEIPVYAVVNKSIDAKNLPPDEMSTEDDISASQSKQTTDVDVIY